MIRFFILSLMLNVNFNNIKSLNSILFLIFLMGTSGVSFSQPCDTEQVLNENQLLQLETVLPLYEAALEQEDLFQIDNFSNQIIAVFGNQAGWPETQETYVVLNSDSDWLNKEDAVLLSRQLIDEDVEIYEDLWKLAKGMKPPDYFPHSIFLRTAAEVTVGLLKIAQNESDQFRKAIYIEWATRALDSLATMQLESGAFPFPDLRPYGDPVFSEIIQNFLDELGPDSVLALQDGWIIDDFGTGEFKFDAGVCGGAFAEAWLLTGNESYKDIALATADYLLPLSYNSNSNYNTFCAYGLIKGFELMPETDYINRAVDNLRFSVLPLQISNGRWADGHNARSIYHNIIITNSVPVVQQMSDDDPYKDTLEMMMQLAVRNLVEQSYNCGASTGFEWLLQSYQLDEQIIPLSLKDSISDLIGNHINQAAINGALLDVYSMGLYFDLLDIVDEIKIPVLVNDFEIQISPRYFKDRINIRINLERATQVVFSIYDMNGRLIDESVNVELPGGSPIFIFNTKIVEQGAYLLFIQIGEQMVVEKIFKQ